MRRLPLLLAGVGIIGLAVPIVHRRPLLVWNATASVPTGLYRIVARKPHRGSLVVIQLSEPLRTLLRGYIPTGALLIKPVAALHGDTLCRHGNVVSINNRIVALARDLDDAGRPLPRWRGCRPLEKTAVAVISRHPDSLDSRYFGPVDWAHLVGLAIPVWTNARQRTHRR